MDNNNIIIINSNKPIKEEEETIAFKKIIRLIGLQ